MRTCVLCGQPKARDGYRYCAECVNKRIAELERALVSAGSRITMMADGCDGPTPMWIQDVLNAG